VRENRTHGSEGGDGESRFRPLSISDKSRMIDAAPCCALVYCSEGSMINLLSVGQNIEKTRHLDIVKESLRR